MIEASTFRASRSTLGFERAMRRRSKPYRASASPSLLGTTSARERHRSLLLLASVLVAATGCYRAHVDPADGEEPELDAAAPWADAARDGAAETDGHDDGSASQDGALHLDGDVTLADAASLPTRPVQLWATQMRARLYGLDLDGRILTSVPVPAAGGGLPEARGLAVDGAGKVHVLTGGAPGYLSTFDPSDGTWTHRTHSGLGTGGHIGAGDVAVVGTDAFVTDMDLITAQLSGLIRFPLSGAASTRLDGATWPEPLAVAADAGGNLWVLGSPARVFSVSPETGLAAPPFELPRSPYGRRLIGMAVADDGSIFVADGPIVLRLSGEGVVLRRLPPGLVDENILSIDVRSDGLVVLGGRQGLVALTTIALESVMHLTSLPEMQPTRVTFGSDR